MTIIRLTFSYHLQLIMVILRNIIVVDESSYNLSGSLNGLLDSLCGTTSSLSGSGGSLGHALWDITHDLVGRFALILSCNSQNIEMFRSVIFDEVGEVFEGSGSGIVDRRSLCALVVQLDGWEALNLLGNVVGGCVDLGDDNLVAI